MSLYLRELGQASVPSAKAKRKLCSWGSQLELAKEFERGMDFSCSSVADEGDLLDEDVLSLTSYDPAGSALLALSQEEQDVTDEGEDDTEPS